MTRVGGSLDKLSPAEQVEWQTSLQAMLDKHETVQQGQQRPATASYEVQAERLSLKFVRLSSHFITVRDSEDCTDCRCRTEGRCDERWWVEHDEGSEDVREEVLSTMFKLEHVMLDWSAHLNTQLANPSTRTVQTFSNVLDGVLGMTNSWGHAFEHDCSGECNIAWPEEEPWPKPEEDEGADIEDIPAVICRVWRDLLLCILAVEHGLPASSSKRRPKVTVLRQRALAHLNIPVASRLPPRGGVLGVLVHDQKSSRQMPKWHDAAIKGDHSLQKENNEPVISNPLYGLTREQLFRKVENFAADKKLEHEVETLKRSALVVQTPANFPSIDILTDEEREVIDHEYKNK
ncbi:unnamed protein product [Tilletia controversa]|nr:unnamed protein product [Tilletia controversa]